MVGDKTLAHTHLTFSDVSYQLFPKQRNHGNQIMAPFLRESIPRNRIHSQKPQKVDNNMLYN